MFRKYAKGKIRLGVDVRRCAECQGPERPCLVDGKPATFHRWVEEDRGVLQVNSLLRLDDETIEKINRLFHKEGIVPGSCSLEKLHEVKALVEWPDGSVGTVRLELITFLDRREG